MSQKTHRVVKDPKTLKIWSKQVAIEIKNLEKRKEALKKVLFMIRTGGVWVTNEGKAIIQT